jgi:hypothetical protein
MFIQNFVIFFKDPLPSPPPPAELPKYFNALDFHKISMPPPSLYFLPGPLSVTNDRSLIYAHK